MFIIEWFKSLLHNAERTGILDWLKDASQSWYYALQTARINKALVFFDGKALGLLKRTLSINVQEYKGLERYRTVTFTYRKTVDGCDLYNYDVTYDNVTMQHGIVIPIGDDVHQVWYLQDVPGKGKRVVQIKRRKV